MEAIKTYLKTTAVLLFGLLLVFPCEINAQSKTKKVKTYKIWITMMDKSKEKGILYAADEAYIKISKTNALDASNLTVIDAQNIDQIKIRKKGKVGTGALIGGLSGVGLSVLAGVSADTDGFFSQEETAMLTGILFVPLGTGIGAAIGSSRQNIAVNGNINNYLNWLKAIQSYSFHPNGNE